MQSSDQTVHDELRVAEAHKQCLWIGGIDYRVSQHGVASLFEPFGRVTGIQLRMTTVSPVQSQALVRLDTMDNAAQAIHKLDGTMFEGLILSVGWYGERPSNSLF